MEINTTDAEIMESMRATDEGTGYALWQFGERTWYATLWAAERQMDRDRDWCGEDFCHIVEIKTGRTVAS